jgi:hypothetical protein
MASVTIPIAASGDDGFTEWIGTTYEGTDTTSDTDTVDDTMLTRNTFVSGPNLYAKGNVILRFDTSALAGATINSCRLDIKTGSGVSSANGYNF